MQNNADSLMPTKDVILPAFTRCCSQSCRKRWVSAEDAIYAQVRQPSKDEAPCSSCKDNDCTYKSAGSTVRLDMVGQTQGKVIAFREPERIVEFAHYTDEAVGRRLGGYHHLVQRVARAASINELEADLKDRAILQTEKNGDR